MGTSRRLECILGWCIKVVWCRVLSRQLGRLHVDRSGLRGSWSTGACTVSIMICSPLVEVGVYLFFVLALQCKSTGRK